MSKLENEKKINISKLADKAIEFIKENFAIEDLRDPFEVISKMNDFIIIKFPSDNEKLSGFSIKKGEYNCIYINSNHVLGRQFFSCWHEFYHCINDLDDEPNISFSDDESIEEKEADYFSSCMLLPKMRIEDYMIHINRSPYNLNEDDLIQMQYYFRVSFQALIFRLNEIYSTTRFFQYKYLSKLESRDEYVSKVKENGLEIDLISKTEDFCVSKSFFKDIYSNLSQDRISIDKTKKIMDMIEERGIEGKWD